MDITFSVSQTRLEDQLKTDRLFVDYFNAFLALPSFPEQVTYNGVRGTFEIRSNRRGEIAAEIRSARRAGKRKGSLYKTTRHHSFAAPPKIPLDESTLPRQLEVDTSYIVQVLDWNEGLSWIKRHRLLSFLRSDYFCEYQLVNILKQCSRKRLTHQFVIIDLSATEQEAISDAANFKENNGSARRGDTEQEQAEKVTDDRNKLIIIEQTEKVASDKHQLKVKSIDEAVELLVNKALLESLAFFTREQKPGDETFTCTGISMNPRDLPEFGSPLSIIIGDKNWQTNSSVSSSPSPAVIRNDEPGPLSDLSIDSINTELDFKSSASPDSAQSTSAISTDTSRRSSPAGSKDESILESDLGYDTDVDSLFCKEKHIGHKLNKIKESERFRKFLKGTAGEKYWHFWLDVNRLKHIREKEYRQRYLAALRAKYYNSGSVFQFAEKQKREFELVKPSDWTASRLVSLQTEAAKIIIAYWMPRFFLQNLNNRKKKCSVFDKVNKEVHPSPPVKLIQPFRPKGLIPREPGYLKPMTARNTSVLFEGRPPKPLVNLKIDRRSSADELKLLNLVKYEAEGLDSLLRDDYVDGECSEVSEFFGSHRMECLLQTLHSEDRAGQHFRRFILSHSSQLWKNCLDFWEELQEYHNAFYQDSFDEEKTSRLAQICFARYIVVTGPHHICCKKSVIKRINERLVPPFEELFDEAEEYAIEVLYSAWEQMIIADEALFGKIRLNDEERFVGGQSKFVVKLPVRRIIADQRTPSPSSSEDSHVTSSIDEKLAVNVPEHLKHVTIKRIIKSRRQLENFRKFLREKFASTDLAFWMDLEALKLLSEDDEKARAEKIKEIREKYLNKNYLLGSNSPLKKETLKLLKKALKDGTLDDDLLMAFLEGAHDAIQEKLEKKWLPLYLKSHEGFEKGRARTTRDSVSEDPHAQRRKKAQALQKMLESQWLASWKDTLLFRKALQNPVTSLHLRKYLSLKGEHYENDVLFWHEVQRYKELCHHHVDQSLVRQKTSAIIARFINSSVLPALQIDITQDMADDIVKRRNQAAPYLFREAQHAVFRILYALWPEFCEYRAEHSRTRLLSAIEHRRRQLRKEERLRKRHLEEQREKEQLRKKTLTEEHDSFDLLGESEESTTNNNTLSWAYSTHLESIGMPKSTSSSLDSESYRQFLRTSDKDFNQKAKKRTKQPPLLTCSPQTAKTKLSLPDEDNKDLVTKPNGLNIHKPATKAHRPSKITARLRNPRSKRSRGEVLSTQ